MKRKVRVKKVPMANGGQSGASKGLERFMYGKNSRGEGMNQFSEPDFEVNNSISSVPREMSNLEAEGGEQAIVPGEGGIPETYAIHGPRHSQGGVPLNLEEDSFVFSDNKKGMKIKDKEILADFGVSTPKGKKKAKGKTPAQLAKKYNINKYKKILLDPHADKLERETAEMMIANYNEKLGKLALVQESMKGFPQGIPEVAKPYADSVGLDPSMFMPPTPEPMPPQAAYGTGVIGKDSLADYTVKNGGSTKRKVKVYQRGGEFKGAFWDSVLSAQDGVQVPTKYKDNPIYQVSSPEFNLDNLQPGDWVQQENGDWTQFTGNMINRASYAGNDFDLIFAGNEDYANAYAELLIPFSNPEVIKAFADQTREAMKKENTYQGKTRMNKRYTDEEIDAFTDEQIVENFLEMQKRNYALKANDVNAALFADADGSLGTKQQYLARLRRNKKLMDPNDPLRKMTEAEALSLYDQYKAAGITSLNEAFNKLNMPVDKDAAKLQQASYWGYKGLLDARDKGELPPEVAEQLKGYSAPVRGYSDEGQTGSKRTSPTDGVYTNTTSAQLAIGSKGVAEYKKPGKKAPEPDPIEPEKPEYAELNPRDEWWAQDIGNIANLANQRLGLKKYLPHSFPVDLTAPDPVYYDPSRALAANAEQAAIANQTLAAFAGPQGTFRATGIMGEGLKNAANIVSDYQTKNVGVANQYAMNRANIENKEALLNAQLASKLYDQNTIANQQFDNAKRQADRNLFEAWRQGITNKMQTQAMNSLYPQFETRPGIGGGLHRTGFKRPFVDYGSPGKGSSSTSYLEEYSKLRSQFGDHVSDDAIKKQTEINLSRGTTDPNSMNPYDMDVAQKRELMKLYGAGYTHPVTR